MDAFAQQPETAWTHPLLSQNPKGDGHLLYQHDEAGELVCVPNVWYNQPVQARVAALRWAAADLREKAEHTEKFPAAGRSLAARKRQAARLRARADKVLGAAAHLVSSEFAGLRHYPRTDELLHLSRSRGY